MTLKFESAFYEVDFEVRFQGPSNEAGLWLRLLTITAGGKTGLEADDAICQDVRLQPDPRGPF